MNARSFERERRDSPEAIAEGINETRAELAQTLDELQARLSPGQLVDQLLTYGRDNVGEFATNLGSSVKRKPLPVLLTGIGLLWTIASREADGSNGHVGKVGGATAQAFSGAAAAASSAGDSLSHAAGLAKDKLTQAADRALASVDNVSDEASAIAEGVGAMTMRLRAGFQRLLDEQPLTIGALGVALGALIGAAVPATDTENRWLGEASDRAREQAKHKTAEHLAREEAGTVEPDSRSARGR